MASHVLGVDLGAYSVKVLIGSPGFRSVGVSDFVERLVPPGDEPHEQRAMRVLGEILRERHLEHDSLYLAVAGDQVFTHVLDLPFKNMRRQDLEKAIGGELESILPIELEDMVFACDTVPDLTARALPPAAAPGPAMAPFAGFDEAPTRVEGKAPAITGGRAAAAPEGMRVLTCTMRRTRAKELIDLVAAQGGEARGLLLRAEGDLVAALAETRRGIHDELGVGREGDAAVAGEVVAMGGSPVRVSVVLADLQVYQV